MVDSEDVRAVSGRKPKKDRPATGLITWIAVFRLVKAALLIAVALGTLQLLRPGAATALRSWLDALPFAAEHEVVQRMAHEVTHLPRKKIDELAVASFAYAALFIAEGVGLLLGKVWAEYLTIVATASFIPFEIHEVMKKFSGVRAGVLIVNVAILIYLVVRRWKAHREGEGGEPRGQQTPATRR